MKTFQEGLETKPHVFTAEPKRRTARLKTKSAVQFARQ